MIICWLWYSSFRCYPFIQLFHSCIHGRRWPQNMNGGDKHNGERWSKLTVHTAVWIPTRRCGTGTYELVTRKYIVRQSAKTKPASNRITLVIPQRTDTRTYRQTAEKAADLMTLFEHEQMTYDRWNRWEEKLSSSSESNQAINVYGICVDG